MNITANKPATRIAGGGHITPENQVAYPGMTTWEIDVLNDDCHIVDRSYHTGWFQEEAERIARDRCSAIHGSTWQVLTIRKEV